MKSQRLLFALVVALASLTFISACMALPLIGPPTPTPVAGVALPITPVAQGEFCRNFGPDEVMLRLVTDQTQLDAALAELRRRDTAGQCQDAGLAGGTHDVSSVTPDLGLGPMTNQYPNILVQPLT
jgi:hypothetical protein